MKLPPRSQPWRRMLYILARIFFPESMQHCNALLPVQREAAFEIRKGRKLAEEEGREHEAALGEYRAGEVLRIHNSKANFDRHAATRARTPINKPRFPREPKP